MKTFVNIMKFLRNKAVFPLCAAVVMTAAIVIAYFATGFENYVVINFVVVNSIVAVVWGVIAIICTFAIESIEEKLEMEENGYEAVC